MGKSKIQEFKEFITMKIKLSILCGFLMAISLSGVAQDYDDIYFDSSKDKKKETKKVTVKKTQQLVNQNNTVVDFDGITNERDVDEYNRRYMYNVVDTLVQDSLPIENDGDFVYTDRIKRFHNPSVIIETNDPDLAEAYYVSTSPEVNIIVGTPSYYWGTPYWYYPSYYTWYTGWYGPDWYTPWYGWGWSFGWTWGPHYHHHHHHWYPGPVYRPGHGVANGGIHRPAHNAGGRRYSGAGSNYGIGRRPATPAGNRNGISSENGSNRRPGMGGVQSSGGSNRRPSVVKNNSDNRRSERKNTYNNSERRSSNRNNGGFSSDGGSRNRGFSGGGSRGGSGGGGRRR